MKAQQKSEIAAGWYSAAFARTERLKPLAEYLGEKPRRGGGNRTVIDMFRRAAARQAKDQSDGNG